MARHHTGAEAREARQARLERHAAETDPAVVMNAAARFLELRSRSVREVTRNLTMSGFPTELIEGAVARLLELGLLDDTVYARAWVESRDRSRPRGESALRRELSLKGIERETIAVVLTERGEAAQAAAEEGDDDGSARSFAGYRGWGDRRSRSGAARGVRASSRAALRRHASGTATSALLGRLERAERQSVPDPAVSGGRAGVDRALPRNGQRRRGCGQERAPRQPRRGRRTLPQCDHEVWAGSDRAVGFPAGALLHIRRAASAADVPHAGGRRHRQCPPVLLGWSERSAPD